MNKGDQYYENSKLSEGLSSLAVGVRSSLRLLGSESPGMGQDEEIQ